MIRQDAFIKLLMTKFAGNKNYAFSFYVMTLSPVLHDLFVRNGGVVEVDGGKIFLVVLVARHAQSLRFFQG